MTFSFAGALALAAAQICAPAQQPANRIAARIDDAQVTTLYGNVPPLARPEFDRGVAPADLPLSHMMLLLQPSAAQQAALQALLAAQADPRSPEFHRWLSPAAFGARFGASPGDLARIAAWLQAHGFTVDALPAGHQLIVFSGTAAGVNDAFHAPIHSYRIGGADYFANAQDPQIPSTFAGVVAGIVSLHNFRHAPAIAARRALGARPQWNLNGSHYLFPADFAAIYNLNPLYGAGTAGSGVSIAIAARSNIQLADVASFRAQAALPPHAPAVILTGADPGLVPGDQDEATLDTEWAGAAAPAASVKLVVAASTAAADGIDLSAQYIVNHALAPVLSVSYASCEQQMGAAELAFYSSLWQQAAAEGISVLVASGDSGAAGCNLASDSTATETGVNGLCSSPYDTCVGGTEFNDGSNPGNYWSTVNNAGQGSALGYIPEVVWNESGANGGAWLWASGGGVSQAYEQPSWQQEVAGAGAAAGMRAVPDLSLSAAAHDGYILFENGTNWVVSGTSAVAPSLAGILALVIQAQGGSAQGNINPVLYRMALDHPEAFHATPSGSNSVPGVQGFYATGNTYNLATGLGSVDANLLATGWESPKPPTLALAPIPDPILLAQGGSASVLLAIATGGAFSGNVTLGLSGLPLGVSASWSANPVAPQAGAASVTLTLSASSLALVLPVTVEIQAQGDGLTATQSLALQVQGQRSTFPIRRLPPPVLRPCGARMHQFSNSNACMLLPQTRAASPPSI